MQKSKYIIIALLSISLISMELIWTRIFSAEFFYTFAFLILSLAVLGLGLGGLSVRFFKFLNKEWVTGVALLLSGLMMIAGPPIVFKLGLNFSEVYSSFPMAVKLFATIFILSSSYYFGGIALSLLFKNNVSDLPKLYMADLVGAGTGVIFAILFMNIFQTPFATFLSAIPILIASAFLLHKYLKIVPLIISIAILFIGNSADEYLEAEREERAPVIYKHWDAMSKIKIFEYSEDFRGINIDNAANTPVIGFDGDWSFLDTTKVSFDINVRPLIQKNKNATFLSLGSGGGMEVFQAIQEGATEIHAVEVNSHINYLMSEGNLAEFSGNLLNDPRVKLVTEDARAYVKRFENKFDVIYSLSSNSFSALASGAFALAENYLFTTEAFEDYYKALSENGYLMMEHQFYIPRIVSEALIALKNLGIQNPEKHIAVFDLPNMRRKIIIFAKKELDQETINNPLLAAEPGARNYHPRLYPLPSDTSKPNIISRIVSEGWQTVQQEVPVDISPSTDNRPFCAQLGMWKNFELEKLDKLRPYEFGGFPLSKIIMIIILGIALVIIVPLNILPYAKKGPKLKFIPWLYFFAIGMGFMMVEVILMQKYALFIGPSVYSVSTILFTLLIASGIGSKFANRFSANQIFIGIIIWLLADIFILGNLFNLFENAGLIFRIIIAALMIAPLGFLMGMPFPKAGLKIGDLIDWGFAVNGAASVVGSTFIILFAIEFGFNLALLVGAICYLFAYAFLKLKNSW